MSPRRPSRAQDAVSTAPQGIAAVGIIRSPATPITAPITVRLQKRSAVNIRVGELLTAVLSGRGSQITLWDTLVRQWGLAPAALTTIRWGLLQETFTRAKAAEDEWHAAEPRTCGPSERSPLRTCTGRDNCGRHRDWLGRWMDYEQSAATWLLDKLPEVADALQAQTAEAPKKGRR